MSWLRVLLGVALIVTALLLQLTVLPFLNLPGAVPDLVAVTVIAIAAVAGPVRGAVIGFIAGVLIDLAPPAIGLIGVSALVLVIVGYVTGLVAFKRDRAPVVLVGVAGLLASGSVLVSAAVAGIVGDPHVSWDRVPVVVVTELVYSMLLAAFVVPAVAWLWIRVAPPTTRYDTVRS